MTIEYEIARKGPDEGVVLRGRTNVHWPEDPGVEHEAHGRVSLHFAAAIERNDGTVDLQMKYREAAPDGTNIRWEPLLHLARGTTATSEVGGAGWSREVRVKVL